MKTARGAWLARTAFGLAAGALLGPGVAAQPCTWGGTSPVPAPEADALRSLVQLVEAPARVASDAGGRLYVTDPAAGRVVVRDELGRFLGLKSELGEPLAIAVGRFGLVYVGDARAGSVAVFDSGWNLLYKLGQGDGEFVLPNHIALHPTRRGDLVYVADSGADEVKIFQDGVRVGGFGAHGNEPGQFDFPSGIFVSAADEVFVGDQNNDRVQVFDAAGAFLRCFGGRGGSFTRRFGRIQGLAGDARGRVYVADAFQGRVAVFDTQGVPLGTLGGFGEGAGQLQVPGGLALDRHNRLWVASTSNGRVEGFGLDAYSDPAAQVAWLTLPEVLERKSHDPFVGVDVEIPGAGVAKIDAGSVTANGVPAWPRPLAVRDVDGDGVPDVRLWFEREELLAVLADGPNVLSVAGSFRDGGVFEGAAWLRVRARETQREAGEHGAHGAGAGGPR